MIARDSGLDTWDRLSTGMANLEVWEEISMNVLSKDDDEDE